MEFTEKLGATAGAVALSFGAAAAAQDAVQWRVEDGGNGHWYRVVVRGAPHAWQQARADAEALGGYLACLESPGEAAWILSITDVPAAWESRVGPWLGGFQDRTGPDYAEPSGGWRWTNGAPWNFSDWGVAEPNDGFAAEHAMGLITNDACGGSAGGRFINDLRESFPSVGPCERMPVSFVIEWSADCNSDGIVDFGQIISGQLADSDANGVPDCCAAGDCAFPPVSWPTSSGGNGHWYQCVVLSELASRDAARQFAQSIGAELASLCGAEFDYVVSATNGLAPNAWFQSDSKQWIGPWIGLVRDGVNWGWDDGSTCVFDRWDASMGQPDSPGSPGENWAFLYGIGAPHAAAHDVPPQFQSRSLLAEWSADCNSDGIVDFGQILAGELEDANGNNIPDCCEGAASCNCPGDIAQDGLVNGVDLAAVLNNWGTSGGALGADVNGDGTVDASDLAIVLGGWGLCP